jgi:hypothetical protein
MHDFLRIKIYHADCIVPQFGDEQPVVRQVDRQMVNAAADIAQGYFMFELQRIRHRLCDAGARKTQMHKSDNDREDYYQSIHDITRYEPVTCTATSFLFFLTCLYADVVIGPARALRVGL